MASNRDREDCSDVTKTGIRTRRAAVVIDWPRRWNVPRNRSSNHQKAMSHTLEGQWKYRATVVLVVRIWPKRLQGQGGARLPGPLTVR